MPANALRNTWVRSHQQCAMALLVGMLTLPFGTEARAHGPSAGDDAVRDMPAVHRDPASAVIPAAFITPSLQLQTWFTPWDQDENPQADPGGYGDPEHDLGFTVPRARFGVRGGYKAISFNLVAGTSRPYDAISPDVAAFDLVSGFVRATVASPAGTTFFTLGQHQAPFSREMQISSNDLIFQERAVSTNWLTVNRDLGLSVRHTYKLFTLSTGLFNGGGNLWGDDDPGVRVAARAELHVGGDTYRTNASDSAFGLGVAYLFDRDVGTTGHRVGVDFLARYKGLNLLAEGTMNFLDPDADPVILPPGVPEVTRRMGGFVQLSYFADVGLGGLEPAVRFAVLDDATHLADNGDVGILHSGLNWREPLPFVDLGATWIHRVELAGRTTRNDSVRAFVGFRYPSRRHQPIDIGQMVRKMMSPGGAVYGADQAVDPPADAPEDAAPKKGKRGKRADKEGPRKGRYGGVVK